MPLAPAFAPAMHSQAQHKPVIDCQFERRAQPLLERAQMVVVCCHCAHLGHSTQRARDKTVVVIRHMHTSSNMLPQAGKLPTGSQTGHTDIAALMHVCLVMSASECCMYVFSFRAVLHEQVAVAVMVISTHPPDLLKSGSFLTSSCRQVAANMKNSMTKK